MQQPVQGPCGRISSSVCSRAKTGDLTTTVKHLTPIFLSPPFIWKAEAIRHLIQQIFQRDYQGGFFTGWWRGSFHLRKVCRCEKNHLHHFFGSTTPETLRNWAALHYLQSTEPKQFGYLVRIDKKGAGGRYHPATQKWQRFLRNETTIWHSELKLQQSNPPAVVLHFYTLPKTQFILQKLCVLTRGSHLRCLCISVLSPQVKQTQELVPGAKEPRSSSWPAHWYSRDGQGSTALPIRSVCNPCGSGDGKETTNSQPRQGREQIEQDLVWGAGVCIISSLHPSCSAHTIHLGAPLKDSSQNWLLCVAALNVNNLGFKVEFLLLKCFVSQCLYCT